MPLRPRQHELEDQSYLAFKKRLPPAWIVRRLSHDYGVDAELEVVQDRVVTGRRALIQLKATDDESAQTLSLDVEACLYYRGLDLPVLLVLYVAPRDEVRVTWFHAIDRPIPERQKTVSVRLGADTVWTADTADAIDTAVQVFRRFRLPGLELPLSFDIRTESEEILGEPAAEIRRLLRAAADEERGLINFDARSGDAATVVLASEATTVSLGGVSSVSFPTIGRSADPERLPFDILTAIVVALAGVRQFDLAARLARRYASRSSIIGDFDVASIVIEAFAAAHRPGDALALAGELDRTGNEEVSFASTFLSLITLRVEQSPDDHEARREYLQQQVESAAGESQGFAHYNLANHLRGRSHLREAFHHYRRAFACRPAYGDSEYWCREVAGLLFSRGRYMLAAHYYARALEIGGRSGVRPLHADALMFSGRYSEALELFVAVAADPNESAPIWLLKGWFLQNVAENGLLHDQVRSPSRAAAASETALAEAVDQRRLSLQEALRHDLLSGLAWFNLGVLENETGNRSEALFAFVGAALSEPWDVEAWMNALALAFSDRADPSLLQSLAAAGYEANGDRLVEQLVAFARSQPEGFPAAAFINAFDQLIRESAASMSGDHSGAEVPQDGALPQAAHVTFALEDRAFDATD